MFVFYAKTKGWNVSVLIYEVIYKEIVSDFLYSLTEEDSELVISGVFPFAFF